MAKTFSWVFGVVLVVAGVCGFFMQPALGFIAADMVSSIIHVVAGVILVAMAGKSSAGKTLKVIGIIYVLWAILGFLGWSFTAIDGTTTWFYLVVGIVMALLGWSSHKGMSAPMSSSAPQM